MLRTLFAFVSGAFAAMIVITFTELANAKLFFPPPPGLDLGNADAIAAYAATMPAAALAVVLLGWLMGAFVGAAVTARLADAWRMPAALSIGGLISLGVIINAQTIAHPAWVSIAGSLLPLPLAYLATKLVQNGLARTR